MSGQRSRPEVMERRQVEFPEVSTFLREYRDNIVHGGLFVVWDAPPAQGTRIMVELSPPLGLPHLELSASVVFVSPSGAGIQLEPRSPDVQMQLLEVVRQCEEYVAAQGRANPGLLQHLVKYDTPQQFLQSWEAELRLGGLLIPVQPSPPPDTTLRLLLQVPVSPDPIRLEARVVYQGTTGAGVQLLLSHEKRQELNQLVERCRNLISSAGTAQAVLTRATPVDASETTGSVPGIIQSEGPIDSAPVPAIALPTTLVSAAARSEQSSPDLTSSRDRVAPLTAHVEPSISSPESAAAASGRPAYSPSYRPESGALVLANGPLPVSTVAARAPAKDDPEAASLNVRTASTEVHAIASMSSPTHTRPVRVSWSGSLSITNMFEILLKLGRAAASGILELEQGGESCSVVIAQGYAVSVLQVPPDLSLRLGAILVHDGQLGLAEAEEAAVLARKEGMLLGQYLIREGALMATTLNQALLRQNQLRLWAAARWTRGNFRFLENARGPRRVGTPPASILHVLFRERLNDYRLNMTDQLSERVSQVSELYLHRMPDAPDDMSGYGLNNDEQRFWHLVAVGRYCVRECFLVSPLSRNRTFAILFTLLELGLVRLLPDMTRDWHIRIVRERIEKKFARMILGNHFDTLDAHWSCTEQELKDAYERTRLEYDSARVEVPLPSDIHSMSREILTRADQAIQALRTWEGRRALRKEVVEPHQLSNAADLLHQQADMAFFKHEYKEALALYGRALELEPGHPEIARKYKELGRRLAGAAPGPGGHEEL